LTSERDSEVELGNDEKNDDMQPAMPSAHNSCKYAIEIFLKMIVKFD
jgi:hypothetical protein